MEWREAGSRFNNGGVSGGGDNASKAGDNTRCNDTLLIKPPASKQASSSTNYNADCREENVNLFENEKD